MSTARITKEQANALFAADCKALSVPIVEPTLYRDEYPMHMLLGGMMLTTMLRLFDGEEVTPETAIPVPMPYLGRLVMSGYTREVPSELVVGQMYAANYISPRTVVSSETPFLHITLSDEGINQLLLYGARRSAIDTKNAQAHELQCDAQVVNHIMNLRTIFTSDVFTRQQALNTELVRLLSEHTAAEEARAAEHAKAMAMFTENKVNADKIQQERRVWNAQFDNTREELKTRRDKLNERGIALVKRQAGMDMRDTIDNLWVGLYEAAGTLMEGLDNFEYDPTAARQRIQQVLDIKNGL
jgi:hypothetical protein